MGPRDRLTAGTVESPLRREAHGGFGDRPGETGREQSRHRAPGLLSDESRQGLRLPKGRTWEPRGCTPVVKVSGGSNRRVSLAALVCIKPGCRPRLIYRVHHARRRRNDPRKGFTESDFARLLDAAHQQMRGPIVLGWDNLNVHISGVMAELNAARDWLRVCRRTRKHRAPADIVGPARPMRPSRAGPELARPGGACTRQPTGLKALLTSAIKDLQCARIASLIIPRITMHN